MRATAYTLNPEYAALHALAHPKNFQIDDLPNLPSLGECMRVRSAPQTMPVRREPECAPFQRPAPQDPANAQSHGSPPQSPHCDRATSTLSPPSWQTLNLQAFLAAPLGQDPKAHGPNAHIHQPRSSQNNPHPQLSNPQAMNAKQLVSTVYLFFPFILFTWVRSKFPSFIFHSQQPFVFFNEMAMISTAMPADINEGLI